MNKEWDIVISPRTTIFDFKLKEIWRYRDLIFLFVRRDFVSQYKQTILGPLWYLIQPVLTTITFTLIFGNLARISTDGIPHIVFYMAGITFWQYFSDSLNTTASVFNLNQNLFGKVYFPRLIVPLSVVTSGLIKFLIQFTLFLLLVSYYAFQGSVHPNIYALWTPVLIFMLAMIALGFGMLFSSLTTKYRDLVFLLTFGIQLWMYATPIIYPLSSIPEQYKTLAMLNPLSGIIETIRFGFLGSGNYSLLSLCYSLGFSFMIFFIGLIFFNKVEKNFMDTV